MKYDWNYLTQKLEDPSNFDMFFAEIEDLLSQALDFETFEIILKEVRLKTHYMTDDQRLIWSIFRYLQILFSLDFEDYSKEISKKHLEKKLLLDKFQKEQAVKEDPNKTTPEKDIILEQLEKKYQSDLLVLNTTYQKQYAEWMHNHKQEVHEYIQIKILIEEWLKAHYKT